MSYILSAGGEIQKYMRKGPLMILESTTYPGTTDEVFSHVRGKGSSSTKTSCSRSHPSGSIRVSAVSDTQFKGCRAFEGFTEVSAFLIRRSSIPFTALIGRVAEHANSGEHVPRDQHRHGERDG